MAKAAAGRGHFPPCGSGFRLRVGAWARAALWLFHSSGAEAGQAGQKRACWGGKAARSWLGGKA